jgi:Tfp pilus assembly protein PilV
MGGGQFQQGDAVKRRAQQGSILIEVLVASALLGLGLAGAARLMLQTRAHAELNLQTGVALQQALDLMECLQSDVHTCTLQDSVRVQGQDFYRQAQVLPDTTLGLSSVVVSVQWRAAGGAGGAISGATHPTPGTQPADARLQTVRLWGSVSQVPVWLGVSSEPAAP